MWIGIIWKTIKVKYRKNADIIAAMAYTIEQCEEVLEKLREATVSLAGQTMQSATVNGVEYIRSDINKIGDEIDRWEKRLVVAQRIAGDYSGSSIKLVG